MKFYLKGLLLFLLIAILIIANCPTNSGGGSGGGGGGGSDSTSTTTDAETDPAEAENNDAEEESSENLETATGTVSGTVNDDATVIIVQSDGTTQSTTTSDDDSDFIFEDVPTGEATVTITNDQGQTTTQTVQVNEGETTQINPFGSTQEMDNSLLAEVFIVTDKGWSTRVSDITETQLGDDFYSKEINVPERSFSEGFPGITDRFEYFGIVYTGQIKAPYSGTYTFKITCDDGAVLWINGIKVVDGDGVHATATYQGTIDLVAGQSYEFLLKYFQGPRYHITLVLENKMPGEEMKLFNSDDY